jgi:hypothetical protein
VIRVKGADDDPRRRVQLGRRKITLAILSQADPMPHSLAQAAVLVARVLAFAAGVLAFYLAFFLYEDEDGVWQSRIDNFWVAVDERARVIDRVTTALFRSAACKVDARVSLPMMTAVDRMFQRSCGRKVNVPSGHQSSGHQSSIAMMVERSIG